MSFDWFKTVDPAYYPLFNHDIRTNGKLNFLYFVTIQILLLKIRVQYILAVYYALDSSLSFRPTFIDFDLVFNMLALSVVFIFSSSAVCVRVCLFRPKN